MKTCPSLCILRQQSIRDVITAKARAARPVVAATEQESDADVPSFLSYEDQTKLMQVTRLITTLKQAHIMIAIALKKWNSMFAFLLNFKNMACPWFIGLAFIVLPQICHVGVLV